MSSDMPRPDGASPPLSTAAPPGAAVSLDAVLGGRVRLYQPAQGYRAAIDPPLLAAATAAGPGDRVLDLGCGVGTAALCLAVRVPGCRVDGLDIQGEAVALARANADLNGVADRVAFHQADAAALPLPVPLGGFDRVMSNPPFYPAGRHTPSPHRGKALSHGESGELALWLRAAVRLLAPRGTVTLIHRADRLDDILAGLNSHFGGVAVLPLWPRAGMAAKRVIIAARLGARSPARLLPGLVLHEADGGYTPQARAVLRDGAPLPL